MPSYQLSICPQTVIRALFGLALFLLVCSMAGQTLRFVFDHDHVFGLVQLFNVDREHNIPTFFTVVIALVNALLLFLTGLTSRTSAPRDSLYWHVLALGFVFIAYDEGFQVHEKLIKPMRSLLGPGDLGVFYFSWVIPGIMVVCASALFFMKFLLRLAPVMRRRLFTAAAVYLGGCLGMELLDGAYAEAFGQDFTYSFLVTIEEGLEMAGLILLARALLEYLVAAHVKLAFVPDPLPQPYGTPAIQPRSS